MNKCFILLLLILSVYTGKAQTIQKNEQDLSIIENIPKESIFVHFNTSLLFVGEYLYYKLYCINNSTSLFSDLSKVAYIELVGENKNIVFKQKILLENGLGNGDFFIPSEVPSGNYKLIAYTNWMKNEGINSFFQNDITIINPYQSDQKAIREIPENFQDSVPENSTLKKENPSLYNANTNSSDLNNVSLSLNKTLFEKRDEVLLSIKTVNSQIKKGSYSLSVRKINALPAFDKKSILDFETSTKSQSFAQNSTIFLPELRGELIKGRVLNLTDNKPLQNIKVVLSIPNQSYQFYYATTNENGIFYMNLDKKHNNNKGYIQVLDDKRDLYSIQLEEPDLIDYSDLNFKKYSLSTNMEHLILERSIHNQIENAFFSFRPDSIVVANNSIPFKKSNIITYNLDEFTRFPTVSETFIEIINQAWIEKISTDNYTFNVKAYEKYADSNVLPLVLIDGTIVHNHNEILSLNAFALKSISIIRDKYIFGTKLYKGIISFETINGDFSNLKTINAAKYIDLFSPQPNKKYYKQTYETQSQKENRLPDDRIQLLWIPNLKDNLTTNINFFTSDISGEFEITIEGFTDDGLPIYMQQQFTVE
tara:strand:+ start:10749 stop:12527 length:1779 start_codon:yes stop_codon:yes gene_type:complete